MQIPSRCEPRLNKNTVCFYISPLFLFSLRYWDRVAPSHYFYMCFSCYCSYIALCVLSSSFLRFGYVNPNLSILGGLLQPLRVFFFHRFDFGTLFSILSAQYSGEKLATTLTGGRVFVQNWYTGWCNPPYTKYMSPNFFFFMFTYSRCS